MDVGGVAVRESVEVAGALGVRSWPTLWLWGIELSVVVRWLLFQSICPLTSCVTLGIAFPSLASVFPLEKWDIELDVLFLLQNSSYNHWKGSSSRSESFDPFYLKHFWWCLWLIISCFQRGFESADNKGCGHKGITKRQLMIKCHLIGSGDGVKTYQKPGMKTAFRSKYERNILDLLAANEKRSPHSMLRRSPS